MTSECACTEKEGKKHKFAYFLYCYMILFLVVIFFKNSSAASLWVSKGLSLCISRLVPSLFPFMVLSSLMISSGAGNGIFRIISKPFSVLFGISENGISSLMLGWLCGFPVGAKCACELFCGGRIDKYEYNLLLCICSTPSPAFLIGTVGKGMLGCTQIGIILYIISLISCIFVGIFMKLLHGKRKLQSNAHIIRKQNYTPCISFTKAVSDAGIGMLNICAFVVFFSAFLGVIEGIISSTGVSEILTCTIFGFFELTSGLSRISSLGDTVALPLCALAVGWSGLSVHFQTISICTPAKCSFSPYMIAQFAKALICLGLGLIIF